jgi:hypothetical protein
MALKVDGLEAIQEFRRGFLSWITATESLLFLLSNVFLIGPSHASMLQTMYNEMERGKEDLHVQ